MEDFVRFERLKKVAENLWNSAKSKFVSDVVYDDATKKIKVTKDTQETEIGVIAGWQDLEHVDELPHVNLANPSNSVIGKRYRNTGDEITSGNWTIFKIPVEPDKTYTYLKNKNDWSSLTVFLDENGGVVSVEGVNNGNENDMPNLNGWRGTTFRVPNDQSIKMVGVEIQHVLGSVIGSRSAELMILEGEVNEQLPYIPYNDDENKILIGKEISHEFEPTGSLISNTVHGAIRELDAKKATLNSSGKIDFNLIPELALNDFHSVQDEAEALQLAQNDVLATGDVVIKRDNSSLYMFMGKNNNDFSDFAPFTVATGTIKTVNGQADNGNGNVTINGEHINATINANTNSIQNHLVNISGTMGTIVGNFRALETKVNTNTSEINTLKTKHPTVQVGDIISTFRDMGNEYTVNGVTYTYCGTRRTILRTTYPNLPSALGIPDTVNTYELPVISDININFDNGLRNRSRKHYIVAHIH